MHTDEAVHGMKFGQLLEEGIYRYDKFDYHGPTLNYFTFIPALIRGQYTLVSLDEFTLRSLTAFLGLALLVLLLFLKNELGWKEILSLSFFLALAPMLVYYSRYYIMEIMLVFFNLGFIISGFKYILTRKISWVISAGIFCGLMMATKETWLIFMGIQAISFLLVLFKKKRFLLVFNELYSFIRSLHFLLFLLSLAVVYIVFYSSFFTWPRGIIESFKAFGGYFNRAGSQDLHQHPWWYYLQILIRGHNRLLFRADSWFLIGGIAGFILLIVHKKRDARHLFYLFFGYTTVFSAIILSVLSYKTPWNFLMVFTGLIFLTNYLASYFLKRKPAKVFAILVIIMMTHQVYQIWHDNFVHHSNPENTFVYSHPNNEVIEISQKVHEISDAIPDKLAFYTTVVYPGHEYWPLPWYLRDLPNIGWRSEVDLESPAAPLVVTKLPNPALSKKLYEMPPPGRRFMYIPVLEEDKELRPGANVNLLLRKDYWDAYRNFQEQFD